MAKGKPRRREFCDHFSRTQHRGNTGQALSLPPNSGDTHKDSQRPTKRATLGWWVSEWGVTLHTKVVCACCTAERPFTRSHTDQEKESGGELAQWMGGGVRRWEGDKHVMSERPRPTRANIVERGPLVYCPEVTQDRQKEGWREKEPQRAHKSEDDVRDAALRLLSPFATLAFCTLVK